MIKQQTGAVGAKAGICAAEGRAAMTVCGPISPDEIDLASMSEHVMYDGGFLRERLRGRLRPHCLPISEGDKVCLENVGILQKNCALAWDALRQDDEAAMQKEVMLFGGLGGRTILDLSVCGTRLDAAALRRISAAAGVSIVASTGFEASDARPAEFSDASAGPGGYLRHIRKEIREGIDGTGVRAGHVYVGLLDFGPAEECALRAAAMACGESGLSMTVKLWRGTGCAGRAMKILADEGADLSRVIFAGVPLTTTPGFADALREPSLYRPDTEAAKAILARGCSISHEFSNMMGLELADEYNAGDWAPICALVALIREGYAAQIVVGTGCAGKIALHRSGGEGFCRLIYRGLPVLRDAAGVSDYALRLILRRNPANLLSA
jgi:phosphotriesterase-related protein